MAVFSYPKIMQSRIGQKFHNFVVIVLVIVAQLFMFFLPTYFLTLQAPAPQKDQTHSNCFRVFDHFVGSALKGLMSNSFC